MEKRGLWSKRFLIIVGINMAAFLSFNMSTSGFPVYISTIDKNNISTGLITSVSAIAALSVRPIAGYVLECYQKRKIMIYGLLLMSVTPLLCILSKNTWIILFLRFLQGAGWGITSTACSTMIANSVPSKRISEGIGYAGALSSIMAAFAPGLAILIFHSAGAIWMLGTISISIMLALLLLVLYSDDEKSGVLKDTPCKDFIKFERNAIFPATMIFCITMSYAPMVTFISFYCKSVGVESDVSFFVAYAFATVIVRPLTGLYVDRWDYYFPGMLGVFSSFIGLLLLWQCNTVNLFCFAGIFAGIGTGAGMNTFQTTALLGVGWKQRSKAISTFLFGFDFGMALGAFISGVLSLKIGYSNMYGVMCLVPMSGCVVLAIKHKNTQTRNKNTSD